MTHDEIIDTLTAINIKTQQLLAESEDRIKDTNKMVHELSSSVSDLVKYNLEQAVIYDKHLTSLENDRNTSNKRCEELIAQNKEWMTICNRKDKDYAELVSINNKLLQVLESSIYAGRTQPTQSTISINTDKK